MRTNLQDLRRAQNALAFMAVCREHTAEHAQWAGLARMLANSIARIVALQPAAEQIQLSQLESIELLLAHADQVELAMSEHRSAWAQLARDVTARRGWIPEAMREEFGNAYAQAESIREAREFLAAAMIQAQSEIAAHAH